MSEEHNCGATHLRIHETWDSIKGTYTRRFYCDCGVFLREDSSPYDGKSAPYRLKVYSEPKNF